jgi:hypothetical protein
MTMCDLCNDAFRNEQTWIDIALDAAYLLEKISLAMPDGPLREEGLNRVAEIRTTPMMNAKKGPQTWKYSELRPHPRTVQPSLGL